jgi:hypothetical protein
MYAKFVDVIRPGQVM